jgi:hypothetical protein
MEEHLQPPKPVPHPETKICPLLSSCEKLVECLRERCGVWTINECALVRMSKGKTSL